MLFKRNTGSLKDCTSGSALVEAAVALPILIFLTVGLMDFALAYKSVSTGQKSIRNAARYMSRLPLSKLCDSGANGGQQAAKNLAWYGTTTAGTTPTVPGWNASASYLTITLSPTCTVATPASDTLVQRKINISATIPYTALAWQALDLSPTLNIPIQHEERWLGQ